MESLNFRIRYDYASSPSGIEVPLTISADTQRSIGVLAKIDTGADFCVFRRELADELELRVEEGERKRFSTATGSFETHGHSVTLSCFDYRIESQVFFAIDYEFSRNVLGLQGWLEKFRFGLVHYDRSFFLSHYDQ